MTKVSKAIDNFCLPQTDKQTGQKLNAPQNKDSWGLKTCP